MISDRYKELLVDPLLLLFFLKDKWMSVHGLPYLHAIHFHVGLAFLLTNLLTPVGKAGADFPTKLGR